MSKPRIFLGSSGKQSKLLQSLARGLEDVADVEPWTATFNPRTTTLGRLVELTREVDFAAFVFAQDDWTSAEPVPSEVEAATAGQASPRDNVVFEPGSSEASSAWSEPSSCTRTARSSRPISWA